jgi:hypothetical protein
MAFIGNTVQTQGFSPAIDYFNGNGVTVTFTLSRPVASVAQMIVAIDNVIQNPSSSFTVSGSSITFTSAPLSGTNNIWVEYTSLITTYQGISQDPSVIGDITATGGFLAEGDFGNTYIDGTIVDYVTGNARITTGPADGLTIYNGGTTSRTALAAWSTTGALTNTGDGVFNGVTVGKGGSSSAIATAVGSGALAANTSVGRNSAFGYNALTSNTSGASNTALGDAVLYYNTTGTSNTGSGFLALFNNTTGGANTAIGREALQANTTASLNTASGYQSMYTNTTGQYNTAYGANSLKTNNADANTAIGSSAMFSNTTGANNVGIGTSALYANTTGTNNVAMGYAALGANTTTPENTAVGYQAAYTATATSNTVVGYQSLYNATTGGYNVAMGSYSGRSVTTGEQNVIIGYSAGNYTGFGGVNVTTGINNVIIGPYTAAASAAAQYSITIGYGCVSAGDNYFTMGKNSNAVFNLFTSNASWSRISDGRLKTDVKNETLGLDFICKLRPVTHKWLPSNEVPKELTRHYADENTMDTEVVLNGFIAQEVKQAIDECGGVPFGGWGELDDGSQFVSREMFVMPLVKAIQEQQAIITSLTARIEALESK